ncbi:MAG: AAA family ATPase [Sneathiella sp.]|uniref:AAA family ATPase n=1 Tax=Sneathiella sp. TaxID=1964365 RepID=UPI00300258C9
MTKRFTFSTLVKSHDINTDILRLLEDTQRFRCLTSVGSIENNMNPLMQSNEQSIILVEIDFDDDNEIDALAQVIKSRGNGVSVIATSSDIRIENIRKLMRIGVIDFLPQPITQEDLINVLDEAVTHLDTTSTTHSGQGKVFSFMKAGGGCGATTVALQTAYSLMGNKKNREKKSVCYLDFDLQFGNAALFLDLDQKHSVQEVIENADRMDGEYLKSVMSKHSSGLYILPAPEEIIPLEAMTPQVAELIINIAAEEFDHVVIDLPMPWTMWTNIVLSNSDSVNLVMQLSVKAIRQSKRILDMMVNQGLDDEAVNIIANRQKKTLGTRGFVKKAEEALHHSIDHFVPNDYKIVSKSQDLGELIPMVKNRTVIEKQIDKLTISCLHNIDLRLTPQLGQS